MTAMMATVSDERIAELAAAAGCDEAEVRAIVDEECAPYAIASPASPAAWIAKAPLKQLGKWVNDKRWTRALTIHRHGMAIGEFVEDGRTVFVPAWANGSLDPRSIADTPRFGSLDEAKVAVDSMFQFRALMDAHRAQQADERRAARPIPVTTPNRMALAASPEYDPTTCWECGGEIRGDGVLDEPMGWAHRSCVGA